MRLRALVASVLVLLSSAGAVAQPPRPLQSASPADLTVTLITFGQGEPVFERFGHNAIWFHDQRAGTDTAYHWGLFNFEDPGFLGRFLSGDTRYSMGPMDARWLVESTRRLGRPMTLQRLDLSPEQSARLLAFVRWNARDENKFYRYDYYRDNCSTRLRDALDHALGGEIKRTYESSPTDLTYRGESVRLTDGDRTVQTGIDIALGRPADVPLTAWESFFIPMRLRDALRRVSVTHADGRRVPLVADERVIAPPAGAQVVTEAASVPRRAWRYLLCGIVLAALVVVLRIMMLTRPMAAWALALLGAGWSVLCGVLGVILLLAWLATRHVFWSANESVLLLSPLSLLLAVVIPPALLRRRWLPAARGLSIAVAAMAALALLLVIVPGGGGSEVVALFLPVHVALAVALVLPRSARAPSPRDA